MRIAVTGSTGLVGSALRPLLAKAGHEVVRIVRANVNSGSLRWDPEAGVLDHRKLEGVDAVIHLAGENIAGGRWTASRKAKIRDSRINGTRLISESLAKLDRSPQVLISASATGYYGDRGNEVLREDSSPGTGFLSEVCQQWEASTDAATRKGIRVVHLRTGLVLSPNGGALGKMLLPFKMGVGGKVGPGTQYWSWISIDDHCAAIQHCLEATSLHGAVNAVAPSPVTNLEFTRVLGKVLSRPTIFPMPAFAARIALGEMANELLLASTRVEPTKLTASRFGFRHRDLESALRHLLH